MRFEPTASRSGPPAYSVPGLDTPGSDQTAPGGGATGTATQTRTQRPFQEGEAGSSTTTSWVDEWLTGGNLVILITVLVVVLGTFLMPLTAWIVRSLRRRRAATRQDLVEIEWDALMSHFDDLGLSAPPGATLRSARERYITDGHLDDEHASAMRRVTATLERARYDRPEADHSGADGGAPPGHSLDPSTGVGHPRVDDPGQVLPLAHRGRLGVA